MISLIIKALGSTPLGGEGCSTLVHLSRASLGGGGGGSTATRRKACLRLEEEGGGDSTATRRKACLRLEEEVAEACGNDLRGLCFRRGIRGGLRRRFEGYSFPERKVRRGTAALLSGFAAVEVKKKGERSVFESFIYVAVEGIQLKIRQ